METDRKRSSGEGWGEREVLKGLDDVYCGGCHRRVAAAAGVHFQKAGA